MKKGNKSQPKSFRCSGTACLCAILLPLFAILVWLRFSNPQFDDSTKDATITENSLTKLKTSLRRLPHKSGKLKVAFAITMTKDGSFQDGAAVLAYSIYNSNMTKKYDVSFVAFVHPNVTTSRPFLTKIGYHVIEVPTPIK